MIIERHEMTAYAAKVFLGQADDASYVSLALDEYRSCLANSPFKVTNYSRDLFASELAILLLESGRKSTAKAVIENMKTPAFKVSGVLALAKSENKPFDDKFYNRLKKYIKEKVQDKDGNRTLAALKLTNDAFSRGKFKIGLDDLRFGFSTGRNFGIYNKQCTPFFVRTMLQSALDLQLDIVQLDKTRRGYNKVQVTSLMDQISKAFEKILNSCQNSKTGTKEYALSVSLHGQILLLSHAEAKEFRGGVLDRDWTSTKQIDFVVRALGKKSQELFEAEYGIRDGAKGSKLVNFTPILKSDRALLPVFKQFVDYGNVCQASQILFQQIKKRNYYDDAIGYMIDADNIDMAVKHNCGDSELELLLN